MQLAFTTIRCIISQKSTDLRVLPFFLVVYSAIIVNDHNAEALPVLLAYVVYTNPGFKSVSLSMCWKVGKVYAQCMVRNVNVF